MNKIPHKVRTGISVGLFLWSIGCIIAIIVYSQNGADLWVSIVGPLLAVFAFILSIVFVPKDDKNSESVNGKTQPRAHRSQPHHKKHKRPFINEKEWEELEEEDEECLYLMDNDDDK